MTWVSQLMGKIVTDLDRERVARSTTEHAAKCIRWHVTDSVANFGKSAESAAHFCHLRASPQQT